MTKRQLIEEIRTMNHTAQPEFLARFQDCELGEYLSHLRHARISRLIGDASRYARFFRDKVAIAIPARPAASRVEPSYAPPTFAPDADEAPAQISVAAQETTPMVTAIVLADQTPNCSEYVAAQFDTEAENYRPQFEDYSCEGDVADLETDVDAMKEQVSVSSQPAAEKSASPEIAVVSVSAGYNDPTQNAESSFATKEDKKWLF